MSPRFGLVGPSYESQSPNLDAQKTVNFYVEQDESGAGNAPIALMSTPGIQSFVDLNPAPPVIAPHFYLTETVFRTGIQAGNTITFNFTPGLGTGGEQIEVGDTVILGIFSFLNNGATPSIPTAVSFNRGGNNFGNFVLVGTISFGAGVTRGVLTVFTAKALLTLAGADVLQGIYTFSGASTLTDYQGNWSCFKHVGALDQISSQAFLGAASFAAPALIVAQSSFILSYIYPSQLGLSVTAASPFFKFSNNVVGCALFYQDPPANDLIAAPGTYTPTWISGVGIQDAGVINFSFKLP